MCACMNGYMYVCMGRCVCVGGLDVYMFVREGKWICMYVYMLVWVWVGAYLLLKLEKPIFLLGKNQQISFF